jgi:hypothetical protein
VNVPVTAADDRRSPSRAVLLALLVAAAVVAAQAALLYGMGRTPICTCGVVKLWHGNVMSAENSQHIADWYTFSHVTHGFLFYFLAWLLLRRFSIAWKLAAAVALEAGWEIVENTDFVINRYRETTISLNYYGDSIINSVFDTLWMVLGFLLAWRLPVLVTVALALAMEAGLAYVIRDNLTLNIIMLLYPFESIKAWQSALPPG